MKIAQIAPLYESVPPQFYGGTERIVSYLTDALVELGHDVTLFAAADARTTAKLVPVRDQSIRLDPRSLKSDVAAHLTMLHEVRRRANDFDMLHFHVDLVHFPVFEDIAERTLTTLHGRLDLEDLQAFYRRWMQFRLVSISDRQRQPLAFANWASTVYHGVPQAMFPLQPVRRGDYLAFLGRISPEKRPDRAIAIAKASGIPLKIAAKVDNADRVYYAEQIAPLIDGTFIQYVGEISEAQKPAFLGNALALLFPIDWPEPFGMVMIEAMGCGTPVVAWNCGSVPEIIEHGVTGYIVQSLPQAIEAVRKAAMLDRTRVRAAWEIRFSATTMAKRYLTLFHAAQKSNAAILPALAIHA